MTQNEAIHTAARRFCQERYDRYRAQYLEGCGFRPGSSLMHAPSEAVRTFPARMDMLDVIQIEIERLVPADFKHLKEARIRLCQVAEEGPCSPRLVVRRDGAPEIMKEESADLIAYLQGVPANDLWNVPPLPFRRTLSDAERDAIWESLAERWHFERNGYFYPMEDRSTPDRMVAFKGSAFASSDAGPAALVRRILREWKTRHIWHLWAGRAFRGADCEADLDLLHPVSLAFEAYWTDSSYDWLIYTSHEGSITVAGNALVERLTAAWPGWQEHLWSVEWLTGGRT